MVVDDTISQALNRIADNQEELNDTLKKILGHYNAVVPPMKEGADRQSGKSLRIVSKDQTIETI